MVENVNSVDGLGLFGALVPNGGRAMDEKNRYFSDIVVNDIKYLKEETAEGGLIAETPIGGVHFMNDSTNQKEQDVASNRSFWMVYVSGMDAPGCRHEAKTSAVKEAERLATKTKKTVYLMRAVEGYKLQENPVVKFNLG